MIKKLFQLDIFQFIYWNFLSKKIKRDKKCYILPFKYAKVEIGKNSMIELHGNLLINAYKVLHSKAEAYVYLRDNAKLIIGKGATTLAYNATIELHDNATVEIGQAYFNIGSVLLSSKDIRIGSDVGIAREVFIYDTDAHQILNEAGEKTNIDKPIIIGNHVWIGLKSNIFKGSKIEDGVVISAGSTVSGKIKGNCLVMGCPARTISLVKWKW